MNKELKKKIQLNRLKQLQNKIKGIEVIEFIDSSIYEIKLVREHLNGLSRHSSPTLAKRKVDDTDELINWFLLNLKFIKRDSILIICLLDSDQWMCKVKVKEPFDAFKELWNMGDICFQDQKTGIGVYIGIDESECYINIRN